MAAARGTPPGRELNAPVMAHDPGVRHLFSAIEAEKTLGIKAATVRSWARRKLLYSFGLNERNHPMYDRVDLVQLRDRNVDKARNRSRNKASRRRLRPPRDRPTE